MAKYENITFTSMGFRKFSGAAKFTFTVNVRNLTGVQILLDGRVIGTSTDRDYTRGVIYLNGNQIRSLYAGGTTTIKVDNVVTSVLTTGRHVIEVSITNANVNSMINVLMTNAVENFTNEAMRGITLEEIRFESTSFPNLNFHHKFSILNETQPYSGFYVIPNLISGITDENGDSPVASSGWTNSSGRWTKTATGVSSKLYLGGSSSTTTFGYMYIRFVASSVSGQVLNFNDVDGNMSTIPIVNGVNEFHIVCGKNSGSNRIYVNGEKSGIIISEITYKRKLTSSLLRVVNQNNWVQKV